MNKWKELQTAWVSKYKEAGTLKGYFSIDGLMGARMVGQLINSNIAGGSCLDVGCGILDKPFYMKIADDVKFTGIDPIAGGRREFEFIKGCAESLPFTDKEFDGVLFATSLNHCKDPTKAINEAYRVLIDNGYLFIWNGLNEKDDSHLWAFSKESLMNLLVGFKIINSIRVRPNRNAETILVLRKE